MDGALGQGARRRLSRDYDDDEQRGTGTPDALGRCRFGFYRPLAVVSTPPQAPIPTELKLKKGKRELEIRFSDGQSTCLSAEYLRVHSPSAEVTGHAAGEGKLVSGKENVGIDRIDPVGRYAVRIVFDDGHDTGLYTWPILHELSRLHETKWQRYLERLAAAGYERRRDED